MKQHLLAVIFTIFCYSLFAQQIAGGELTYKCLGSDNYEITLVLYAKCPNPNLPTFPEISYYASGINQTPKKKALSISGQDQHFRVCEGRLNKCEGGANDESADAILKRTYKGYFFLDKKLKNWVFETQVGPRVNLTTLTTGSNGTNDDYLYLVAKVDNTIPVCNSSATFENAPWFFSPADQPVVYDPLILNPDKDKLQISLIRPRITNLSNVDYIAPYSATQPLSTKAPFSMDGNGKISYTPTASGERSTLAIQVKDIRNGVEIGSVMREMYLQVLNKQISPPYFTGGDTLNFCEGDTVTIGSTGKTNDPTSNLNIIWNNPLDWKDIVKVDSGKNYSVRKGNGSASFQLKFFNKQGTFTHRLDLTLIDDKCGKVNKSIVVRVNQRPYTLLNIRDTSVICLNPFLLKADPRGGKPPYHYSWSTTSVNSGTISVTSANTYKVTVTDANNCKSLTDSAIVRSPINFVWGTYCVDLNNAFYDVSNNPSKKPDPVFTPLPGTKTWKWRFGDGSKESSEQIPRHKFAQSGTYPVTMEISDGKDCKGSITKLISICDKPGAEFIVVDSCVSTKISDLKIDDLIGNSGCAVADPDIKFFINGQYRTTALSNRHPSRLGISSAGTYQVKMQVTNEGGCINESTKSVTVYDHPILTPEQSGFYYRCDRNFPDTVFRFTGNAVGKALVKSPDLVMTLTDFKKTNSVLVVTSGTRTSFPYHITENQQTNISFNIADSYGCTISSDFIISDPVTPQINLEKYYCFLNDTLKLKDSTLTLNDYHWGLKKSVWDMKDGTFENTNGRAYHAYSLKSLDEALVKLKVEDNTGCTDSTSFKVYLSEPDTNEFKIVKPLACYADTVRIMGIKGQYINSWYYRYRDQPQLIYDKPDKLKVGVLFNDGTFPNQDTILFFNSNKYIATTSIFYNEPDTSMNFAVFYDQFNRKRKIIPNVPAKVCHYTLKRPWRIVERLQYTLPEHYDHCLDSSKTFQLELSKKASNFTMDTSSLRWYLYSPGKKLLDSLVQNPGNPLKYSPNTSLFTEIATTRPSYNMTSPGNRDIRVGSFLPYQIKIRYSYYNDSISCRDTASLWVANEQVKFVIDRSPPVSCLNFTRSYFFKQPQFLESISVKDTVITADTTIIRDTTIDERYYSIWDYGDNSPREKGYLIRRQYEKPGFYTVSATVKNYYGCPAFNTAQLTIIPAPIANLSIGPVCSGRESIMDASLSKSSDSGSVITSYYWFYGDKIPKSLDPAIPGDTTEPDSSKAVKITTVPFLSGKFHAGNNPVGLVVRDANGCYDETEITSAWVKVMPKADFTATAILTNDEDYLGNEPIAFDEKSNEVNYWRWNMGNGQVYESPNGIPGYDIEYTYPYYAPPYPKEKNIYNVSLFVSSSEGCIDSISKKIDVNVYFVLPNTFSPNEDGLHDTYLAVGKGIRSIDEFKVFNRWGEVIYQQSGKPEKDELKRGYLLWDGTYKGQVQPVGVYVYYCEVSTGYGDKLIFKGNLTLLK